MQPIISPFTIYIIEHLHDAMSGLSFLCGLIISACAIAYMGSKINSDERTKRYIDNIMEKIADETRIKNCTDEEFIDRINKMMKYGEHYIGEEEESNKYRINLIRISCICIFIIILNNFIPTRDTMYKMLIVSYITPDNLDIGVNFTRETFEYFLNQIVETINKIR